MILFHGSNVEIDVVDLRKCRPNKDFGQGFYLTDIPEQALKMAKRVVRIYGGEPVVTYFDVNMDALLSGELSTRVFQKPDIAWATFVMTTDVSSSRRKLSCVRATVNASPPTLTSSFVFSNRSS